MNDCRLSEGEILRPPVPLATSFSRECPKIPQASKTFFVKTDARQASGRRIQTPPGIERNSQMREDGYCSVQILKSALAALESTAGRLSVSALAIGHSLTAGGRSLNLRAFPGT